MLSFSNKMLTEKTSCFLGDVNVWWQKLSKGGVPFSWTQVLHLLLCKSGWFDYAFLHEDEKGAELSP